MMKKQVLIVLLVLAMSNVASATIVQGIDIDFVTIGNSGNSGDTRIVSDGTTGYGAVAYDYSIGKYEITNGQWDAFVSAAGSPNGNMSDAYDENVYWTGANMPANNVSWLEAAQFCNYLTSGDKSQGAYLFSGNNANPGDFLGIDRDSAVSAHGVIYAIPTEDEWYKAAYYTGSGYSNYAFGTNNAPVAGVEAYYSQPFPPAGPWQVGDGIEEQNGTFDMMGNVFEFSEALIAPYRNVRGGMYLAVDGGDEYYLSAAFRGKEEQHTEADYIGFRVSSIEPVPEPTTLALLTLGTLIIRRRRE